MDIKFSRKLAVPTLQQCPSFHNSQGRHTLIRSRYNIIHQLDSMLQRSNRYPRHGRSQFFEVL